MCRTTLIFEDTFSIFDTNWQNVNIHRFDQMDSDEESNESEEENEEETNREI